MEDRTYFEWYSNGIFAPHVRERRLVASTPAWMFDIRQPAGDFPDPPLEEITIIRDMGRARVQCDLGAGRYRPTPGGLSVVPVMSATQITVDNPHHIRVMGFSPRKLADWTGSGRVVTDLGHLHSSTLENVFLHQLLDRMWDAGSSDGAATSLYSDAALLTLWAELLREAKNPPKNLARGGLAPWQIRRCTDYLNEHAGENIGLEQLAALVGLSPFHFARAFKRSTGLPPHRYQLGVRIARAKALLEATDKPVTQIAFDVGYESPQALARLFQREVGVSPRDYRRQYRQ